MEPDGAAVKCSKVKGVASSEPSGMGGAVGGYTGAGAPWMANYRSGDTLYVFSLFEPRASAAFHGGAR